MTTIGQVGLGYWGPNLARNFASLDNARLKTLCDLNENALQTFGEKYPQVQTTSNFETLLHDDEIHGIAIATPAETHFDLASRVLSAGKDAFVEKPLALTLEHGAELVRLAKKNNRILMVGHVLEYHPAIVKLHEMVQSGELGKVRYIYSNRLSLGKIRREENILWSFAPHDIAVILRLSGGMPFQVNASGGAYVTPNIADVTVTNLLFDGGVRAHIFVSWLHPFKEQRLVVVGSKKMASFDDVSKELMLYDQRVDIHEGQPVPVKGEGQKVNYENAEPLRRECEAFVRAIETREPPKTSGQSGLDVLRVLNAAQRSLMTGGDPVTLPFEN